MAGTIIQNCQRGIIFLCFLKIVFFFIMVTIKLIRKKIDKSDEEIDSKYKDENKEQGKEGDEKPKTRQKSSIAQDVSSSAFDQAAIQETVIEEDDTTIIKIIKRTYEIQVLYLPLLLVIPLNIVTGTSKAFCLVMFFFIIICLIIFNVTKVHRKCVENKCVRIILESIWAFLCFFVLLNIWTTQPTRQPYILKSS